MKVIYAAARRAIELIGLAAIGMSLQACTAAPIGGDAAPPTTLARIAILVSSDRNRCYDPGTVKSIRHFATTEVDAFNRSTPRGGRKLAVDILDDFEEADTTVVNVRQALAAPDLVAMVGLPSSTRAAPVFASLGNELRASEVPFLSEISLNAMFAAFPNVYSMTSTVDDELQVVKRFIKDRGFQKPAFVGLAGDAYSMALGDGLMRAPDALALIADHRIAAPEYKLDAADGDRIAADLLAKAPDLLILAIQSGAGGALLKQLTAAGIDVPVFVLYGRLSRIIDRLGAGGFAKDAYEIARDGVPGLYNERLQRRIWDSGGQGWLFEDTPNRSTPGWSEGSCTVTASAGPSQILDARNRRAIARGMQYRDMIAMIGEAVAASPPEADAVAIRRLIASRLRKHLDGQDTFRGLWQDWAFTPHRTIADDTLVTWRRGGSDRLMLAPWQYRRTGQGLQPVSVLYTSLDLIRISRIDTGDDSFDAELYLSLHSEDASLGIADIEFTNALRSEAGHDTQLIIREIHGGSAGTSFPAGIKAYKIAGRFTFEPELDDYPFDLQRLSVSFQPASTLRPFLIQPPEEAPPRQLAPFDGWELRDGYVGSDHDIVPTLAVAGDGKQTVRFYKFNQTFVVARLGVDFTMRVIVPLAFILLVTYFSVFLGRERFDSMIAIQVTALLSAIALYLSLPDVGADQATLADRIFMVTYAGVALMIGLSVIGDSSKVLAHHRLAVAVRLAQCAGFPLLTIGAMLWLVAASLGRG